MRRSPSEDLFRLIKSLHKGEKRNFKLLTGLLAGGRDKKYIELFDLIDRQDAYNESKLLAHFGNYYGGQFSAGTHYLYKFVLKSLVYYANDSESEMASLKAQVRVLARKELPSSARKLLKKALREAEAGEFFAHQHDLLSIEMDLLMQELSEKNLAKKLEQISEAKRKSLDLLGNLDAYQSLSNRLHILTIDRNVVRREQDIEAFKSIADDPLLQSPSEALSVRAQVEYYSIQSKMARFRDDLAEAVSNSRKVVELMEENPRIKDRMLRRYFLEVSNLGIKLLAQGFHKEAFETLSRVKALHELYPNVRSDFLPLYYIANVTLAIEEGNSEGIVAILPDLDSLWAEINARSPGWHEMFLSYLMAYFFLVVAEPAKGLRWGNLIVNSSRSEQRIYLQSFARLLMLMVHFDQEDYMVVESNLPNVRRFLEKHDRLQPFENLVLRSLRSMVRHVNTPEYAEVLQAHLDEFNVLAEDEFERRAMSLLDFRQWLQSKIENSNMAAIRREANKKVQG